MADDRMNRIERDNAEVLHFLETPVRWLMNAIKAVFSVVVLALLLFVNQLGWMVDLGDRSGRGRISRNNELESQLAVGMSSDGGIRSVFDVDFRSQPDVTDEQLDRFNRFWDTSHPFGIGISEMAVNRTAKAFSTTWSMGGAYPDEGIPYCMADMHPDRTTGFFDATPGSWWTRNDDALDRKSARMQRDYEIAAMMTAALRSTLAHLWLRRPVSEIVHPHWIAEGQPSDPGYCDADSAAHDPRYGVRGTQAYRRALLGIKLQHAPLVRFRYVDLNPNSSDSDMTRSQNGAEIWGMCLPDYCSEGLGRGTTLYADLFADQAPLTDEQMLAENAIMAMTTEAF